MTLKTEEADLHETAARWMLTQERGAGSAETRRLTAWLDASPRHRDALEAARAADEMLQALGGTEDLGEMRRTALAARPAPRPRHQALGLAAASVAVLALSGALAWSLAPRLNLRAIAPAAATPQTRFATAVGERSTATLPDGSLVSLNTGTVLDVDYSDGERAVRLRSGQAQFNVTHGSPLPFRVYAGDQVVTATGTVFDVNLAQDDVRVALLQGQVTVEPAAPDQQGRRPLETLSPGEVLVARPGAMVSVRREDVHRLAQWREGLVAFDDTPLSEAVQEINRYTERPVTLASAEVGRLRVSGTFRVAEPDRFAYTIADVFLLDVKSSVNGITLSYQK